MTQDLTLQGAVAPRGFRFTRKRILAIALIIIGLLLFGQNTCSALDPGAMTRLTFQSANDVGSGPTGVSFPTTTTLYASAAFLILSGFLGLIDLKKLSQITTGMMVTSGIILFPVLLIMAAAGGSTNIITMVTESLRLATPIAIGAMAGIWCERTGVINIAIEGMMLFGAAFGFTALFLVQGILPFGQAMAFAVAVAILTGGLVSLLHAWLSITFSTDQIVSGTVINILALGVTSFMRREVLLSTDSGLSRLPAIRIPILADIPVIGEALFNNQPIFYLMFLIIIATHVILFNTKWGLRTRAVGENPHAADTLGIKVNQVRWINVFIGGLIAGLAGAWFSLEATGRFTDGMTNGSGFISLAAMIFGKWTPIGSFGGALLFGFSDAFGKRLQIIDFQICGEIPVPQQFLQMVPYIVTMIVLAGLVGKAIAPKAVGQPYKKE